MNFKIKKGHFIGFFATVLVFGMVFLYIYNGTMETVSIYNLSDHTSEKVGKNIYTVVYSEDEKHIAWVTYKGCAKIAELGRVKDVLYSHDDINSIFMHKNSLIMTDKNGKLLSYNYKTGETVNFREDCFNKTVFLHKGIIYIAETGCITSLDPESGKAETFRCGIKADSPDNIKPYDDFLAVFSSDSVSIFSYDTFKKKTYNLENYKEKGLVIKDKEDLIFVYVNHDGEVIVNSEKINLKFDEAPNPHSLEYAEANKSLLIGGRKKTLCLDSNFEKKWEKEMFSDKMTISPSGSLCASIYSKANTCVYDVKSGEEMYSLGSLKNAVYSPTEKYITATIKSMY